MGLCSKSIINYSYNVASLKQHNLYHKAFQILYLCNYPHTIIMKQVVFEIDGAPLIIVKNSPEKFLGSWITSSSGEGFDKIYSSVRPARI